MLLHHYRRRIIYGIELVRNVRDYLLGIDKKPIYLTSNTVGGCSSKLISDWWIDRWLLKRIQSDSVLEQAERQNLTYPIRHGARVVLPDIESDQVSLFPDLE